MIITEMMISCADDNYRNGDLVWVTITEIVISYLDDNYRNGDRFYK